MKKRLKYQEISKKIAGLSPRERDMFIKLLEDEGIDISKEIILPRDRSTGGFPLSFAQERLWFLDRMVPGSSMFNITQAVCLKGELNTGALEQSLNEIVKRHETLRTTFKSIDGEPIQAIAPSLTLPPAVVDLRHLSGKERDDEIKRLNADFSLTPFNLSEGPLLRCKLAWLSDREHVMFFTMHHIISDGWSSHVLIKEFTLLYGAFHAGKPSPLTGLSIQYLDFACWQRQRLQGDVLEKQLSYWRNKLSGELPVLQMPTDRPRPSIQTFRGAIKPVELPDRLCRALRQLGQRTGCTLFMTLLAGFQTLLHRYTGQTDIIVGTGLAGRNRSEIEDLIGLFVNNLFLRTHLSGNFTVEKLLNQVKNVTIEAYENSELPFQVLVDKLKLERDISLAQPVTQIMISLQNFPPQTSFQLTNLVVEPVPLVSITSKYDLTFSLDDHETKLSGFVEYSTELFDSSTIDRLWKHYLVLLEAMVSNPGQHIAELPFLTDAERYRLLETFNATTAANLFPEKSLGELFEEQARKNPGAEALVDEHRRLSYARLDTLSNQLAYDLRQRGVQPHSIVALMEDRSANMIISILAILKAGAAYLPIDHKIPEDRLYSILEDSRACALVTREHLVKHIPFIRLKKIQSLENAITITAPRPKIMNLDSLPFPDRGLVDYEKYDHVIGAGCVKKSISLLSSRGCPYRCLYCHQIMSKTFVQRSAENIFAEVRDYYDRGYSSFVIVDDVFNLDKKNSSAFFEMVIKHNLKLRILFPNGLRGDILTPDYIDLMVEGGVIEFSVALESASPRIQKLIRKGLNIDKLMDILQYTAKNHPDVILDLSTMIGFPTETEEEALMTFGFVKSIQWLHFPAFNTVKIYPGTEMARIALENGATPEQIRQGADKAYHELPAFLPFSHSFARRLQTRYLNEYFLLPQRLDAVIKTQKKQLSAEEIIEKYEDYLPGGIRNYPEITRRIDEPAPPFNTNDSTAAPISLTTTPAKSSGEISAAADKLRILMLDLSQHYTGEKEAVFDVVEPPLGLMYLLTYLKQQPGLGSRVCGKILKSRIDFDTFDHLAVIVRQMHPHMICIRTLTFFREFFHKTVSLLKQWYPDIPIITGGPYASSDYHTVLGDLSVDICVLGEGELIFVELVEKFLENQGNMPPDPVLAKIQGIAFIPQTLKNLLARDKMRNILLVDKMERPTAASTDRDLPPAAAVSSPAYVLYTSGSTGKPKGVMIEHRAVTNLVTELHRNIYRHYPTPLKVALIANYTFDASVQQMFAALLPGHTLLIVPDDVKRDKTMLLNYYRKHAIDISDGTPSLINLLTHSYSDLNTELHLKHFIIGGEAFHLDLAKNFHRMYGNPPRISNVYGPTECCVDSTVYLIEPHSLELLNSIPIGTPLGNTRIYILDRYNYPVPVGVPGEIHIAGLGVGKGYLNRIEMTHAAFLPDIYLPGEGGKERSTMYRTGDIGKWLPDGNIEFLGRNDLQVKIRGFRIELEEIASILRSHEAVRDSLVLSKQRARPAASNSGEEKQLLAYVVPDTRYLEYGEKKAGRAADTWEEQLSDWEKVFNSTYSRSLENPGAAMDIVGWNSSYTGQPIPEEEMREWVDCTVSRILSFEPRRVIEVGCGTGLILFRTAPHCEQYIGTDFSAEALDFIGSRLNRTDPPLPRVRLMERTADDLSGIENQSYDMVILNSVVQYFPGFNYLVSVLEEAVRVVEDGGIVFIGDIRSLRLLETYCASVELFRSDASLHREQLNHRVKKRMKNERELVIDLLFFPALKRHIPRIHHVEALHKRGKSHNEMTRFRFDAVLYIGSRNRNPEGLPPLKPQWHDWQEQGLSLTDISRKLQSEKPLLLGVANIPNSRVIKDIYTVQWLIGADPPLTAGDFRQQLAGEECGGVDPEAFWKLGSDLSYDVKVICSNSHSLNHFHAAFFKKENPGKTLQTLITVPEETQADSAALDSYVNNPREANYTQKLVPVLRRFMEQKLPDYMIPAEIFVLEAFPLNSSGKVDFNLLPDSDGSRPELESAYIAPKSRLEQTIANAIKDILQLDRVGINDNFFELGFDSLLIIRLHNKIQKRVNTRISLVDIFQFPTIRMLAGHLSQEEKPVSPLLNSRDRAKTRQTLMNKRRQYEKRFK
jgi:amino acid adenylation domain-containing protein